MPLIRAPRPRPAVARRLRVAGVLLLAASFACSPVAPPLPPANRLEDVRRYIAASWTTLTRTAADLSVAARDPKVPHDAGRPWPVYVATSDDVGRVRADVRRLLGEAKFATIDIRPLPADPAALHEHGLLYLPRPYVVPGGRFNEMYGWDSYFIELGLLADNRLDLVRDIVENFLYEQRRFGKILNANRTYYLTRSQPPFLTRMILALYERTGDRDWLQSTVPAIEECYRFWTTEPHLIPALGLSRYFDLGEGPAPEVLYGERDASGRSHYDRVRAFYRQALSQNRATVDGKPIARYYDRARDELTPLFYKGDRSMRESGFDPSDRFGPFGADIIHYAPVCLNTLLFQMERDAAEIAHVLADDAAERAWRERARVRRERIDRYLWDERAGLYFDYDVETGTRRQYPFATSFYPLWSGAATSAQAGRVRANLSKFEAPGGLLTSTSVTGSQWDAPYGWAPLQMLAVDGLRRYGYEGDADRVAAKFVSLVVTEFERTGTIVEKYDVARRTSAVGSALTFGYRSNEVGFGWTNAAVLHFLARGRPITRSMEARSNEDEHVREFRRQVRRSVPLLREAPGRKDRNDDDARAGARTDQAGPRVEGRDPARETVGGRHGADGS